MTCICSRPDATSPDDPWVNPNCPAHGRYSLGNVWDQKQRDIELKIAFGLIFLALALRAALLMFEPYIRAFIQSGGIL